jgi:hypothetical protein
MTDLDLISRIVFGFASAVLMVLAVALVLFAVAQFPPAFRSGEMIGETLLEAIGYVVIAIAVFDVGKYIFQEEVVRGREMRAPSEARRSLTKFISTITIAVFLEALVVVFAVSKQNVPHMIYPTLLLVAGVLLILGMGAYQRMSVGVERLVERSQVPAKDESEQT